MSLELEGINGIKLKSIQHPVKETFKYIAGYIFLYDYY